MLRANRHVGLGCSLGVWLCDNIFQLVRLVSPSRHKKLVLHCVRNVFIVLCFRGHIVVIVIIRYCRINHGVKLCDPGRWPSLTT